MQSAKNGVENIYKDCSGSLYSDIMVGSAWAPGGSDLVRNESRIIPFTNQVV